VPNREAWVVRSRDRGLSTWHMAGNSIARRRRPTVKSDRSDEKLTLSVDEAARLLGISPGLAYGLVYRGELAAIRLGRRILIPGTLSRPSSASLTTSPDRPTPLRGLAPARASKLPHQTQPPHQVWSRRRYAAPRPRLLMETRRVYGRSMGWSAAHRTASAKPAIGVQTSAEPSG
jgi:excisionase family DNA binding protein